MKKRKLIICLVILGIGILIYIVLFLVKYVIPFEVKRKIITQYEDNHEYDTPWFNILDVEYMKELCDESGNENLIKLGNLLDNVDGEKYNILIIYGGKLESFKLRLDHSLSIPDVKYSTKNYKSHVEYYLIEDNRWIDVEVQFCNP